ncbi:MAG: radical SAM protein, partial [Ruminococcus sp.]
PGEFVIRFMSSHPKDATPELLDTILQCSKVGHHLHLPVQSGSNDVLRRMNRKYTVEKYMESVNYLRRRDPDFSLTTDLIVGFPDETEEDFQGTLDLVQRCSTTTFTRLSIPSDVAQKRQKWKTIPQMQKRVTAWNACFPCSVRSHRNTTSALSAEPCGCW